MTMYINSFVGCLPVSSGVGFWPHPILTSEGAGAKKPGYYLGELLQQHQQQQHPLGVLTPHPFGAPSLGPGYLCSQPLSPTPASSAGLAPLQALCSTPGVSAFMTRGSAPSDRSSSSVSDRPPNPPPLKFGISRILSEDFGKSKSEKENRYKLMGLGTYPEDGRSHPGCPCNSPACPALAHHPHHPHHHPSHAPFPSPVLSAVTALQPPQYPVGNGADALPGPYSILNADSASAGQPKRKRSWSRAVFSNLQRKGLEKRFEVQKYVTKPDRRQLASMLGLTDAQVKVWFQNRRMKWRHAQQQKEKEEQQKKEVQDDEKIDVDTVQPDDQQAGQSTQDGVGDVIHAKEGEASLDKDSSDHEGCDPCDVTFDVEDSLDSSDAESPTPKHVTGSTSSVLSPQTPK